MVLRTQRLSSGPTLSGWNQARTLSWRSFLGSCLLTLVVTGASVQAQDQQSMPPPAVESAPPETAPSQNNGPARSARERRSSSSTLGRQASELKRAFEPITQPFNELVISLVDKDQRVGLGFVVDKQGHVVTKASQWKPSLQVQLPTGKRVDASEVARDADLDLILLQVDYHPDVKFAWANLGQVKPGNFVVNVGPQAEVINVGVLSVRPRDFRVRIPRSGFLGVSTIRVDEPVGIEVTQVVAESAAVQAGLQQGDKITHISGRELRAPEQLSQFVNTLRPGDEVELRVLRNSNEMVLKAKLGTRTIDTSNFDRWGGGPFTSSQRFGFGQVFAHDAPLAPDDCGGPVINSRGAVVGINISRALRISTYAIPAEQVRAFVAKSLGK